MARRLTAQEIVNYAAMVLRDRQVSDAEMCRLVTLDDQLRKADQFNISFFVSDEDRVLKMADFALRFLEPAMGNLAHVIAGRELRKVPEWPLGIEVAVDESGLLRLVIGDYPSIVAHAKPGKWYNIETDVFEERLIAPLFRFDVWLA